MGRKLKIILGLLLVLAFFTGSISYAAEYTKETNVKDEQTEEDLWLDVYPNWSWGERMWETVWGSVRELASDNIGKFPKKKTVLTIPEGIEVLKAQDMLERLERLSDSVVVEIKLPESLRKIEPGVLENLWYLQRITIPSGVTEIPENIFYRCEHLRTIVNLSSQTLRLTDRNENIEYRGLPGLEYYVDGEKTTEIPPGKTAVGVGRTFSLSYDLHGGKMVGKKVKTYRYGEPETKLPTAKKKGAIFLGWSFSHDMTSSSATYHRLYNENGYITGDKTLVARWLKIKIKKAGMKGIQIRIYNRDYVDNWPVGCLYSTKKNMKGAKLACLWHENYKQPVPKKKKICVIKTKKYVVNYYPKKKMLTLDLKKLKKGKTYYLQFRRMLRLAFPSGTDETYSCLCKKKLKTVKVKL